MPRVHFLTNAVTMNDVANICIACGGSPMMAEAVEEFAEIIPRMDGLVLNTGTADNARWEKIVHAHRIAVTNDKPILFDPVGCSGSTFRLKRCLDLLNRGGVTVLKCNYNEAKALVQEQVNANFFGVDSEQANLDTVQEWAKSLWEKYAKLHLGLVVVITGSTDVIVSQYGCECVEGGAVQQRYITGSGCMLGSLLMTKLCRHRLNLETKTDDHYVIKKGLVCMKRSSMMAAASIKGQRALGNYKVHLIDHVAKRQGPIYLITTEAKDADAFSKDCLPKTKKAIEAGVAMLQYRVKHKSWEEKLFESRQLQKLARDHGVTFIINDDLELATTIGADGIHLGSNDCSVARARQMLGPLAVIGATAKTVEQACRAMEQGASYLGVGALFPSPTKPDALAMNLHTLEEIHAHVPLPLYGIGGVTQEKLSSQYTELLDGVAMVSAVYKENTENIFNVINAFQQLF